MITGKSNTYWTLVVILLIIVIAVGGMSVWSKYRGRQPIEINVTQVQEAAGQVYVGGAVNNPGIYPITSGDSLEALIQAAGGTTSSADLKQVKLHVTGPGEGESPQKIDINRAEAWLLTALPGIGEVRAKAIVEYRLHNGPFRNITELTKVEGIGATTYQEIKHLITVAD